MKISIMQPAYLPWPGYLDRIAKSDLFVLMDDVQFERGSFINRNKIKDQHGWRWITVPVRLKGHTASKICETQIDSTRPWAENHLKQIFHAYRRAPRFFENYKELEALYQHDLGTIDNLCLYHLAFWKAQYGIKTETARMPRNLDWHGKTTKIIAICKAAGANVYLAGPQSRDYLDLKQMEAEGIAVEFHDYTPPTYSQLWVEQDFIPGLSILDMWMNTDVNPWETDLSLSLPPTQTMRPLGAEALSLDTSGKEIKSTS